MKLLSHLASLSAAATLLLQLGTFVEASPFFTENTATAHSNAADTTQQCDGLRFSFPSATGLSFEENSKHVVAWQAPSPSSLDDITLTLVNDNDSSSPISVGTFKYDKGATDELPVDLKGQQPGNYHYHIQAGNCAVDSVGFTIDPQQKTTQTPTAAQSTNDHDNNDETFDNLVHNIKGLSSDNKDSTDSHLDELVNELKQTESTHSNDETFDELVSNISKSQTAANSDQSLNDLVNNLKSTETRHSNDQALDDLVNNLKSTESQHTDDQVLEGLVNDLKQSDSRYANDQTLEGLVNDLKTTENKHSNDDDFDNLVAHLPNDNHTKSTSSHQDIALNSDLDSLSATNDDDLDSLVNDIAKTTQSNDEDHHNDVKSSPDWDSMINELSSHKNEQEPKKDSTQGLDQVIDDLAKSIKDKTHSDADESPEQYESFSAFIDSLDQDYTKYLQNNKESESTQVSHKNDAKLEPASHANEWFTNTDLRSKNTKRSFVKRGENDYFTNEDRRTTHGNEAVPATDPIPPRPVWSTNGGYFTNDDQRSNVNSGVHNDAEWAEDAVEPSTSRPVWAVNGGFFTNDDQRTNVDTGVHNDAEWAEDASEPVVASRPVWAVNGGFFTNDDQRTNVNSGAHNDAEWAEDAVATEEQQQDGVWHMDEIADLPEWNVDSDDTTLDNNHQDSVWESSEAPIHHPNDVEWTVQESVTAPIHHPNDIEWNVHDNETPAMDHTNFVHWDSESIDAQVEEDDDNHLNAAPEGEWVDDDHLNAGDGLEWAKNSVDLDDEYTHDNEGQWQTSEHANDADQDDNRWSLNDDVHEWSTNSFDENDVTAANDHTDAAPGVEETPQWLSSEHANDDHEDDASWSVNDGPSEWTVDENAVNGEPHYNDATFISSWLTSEHANDDHEDEAGWNVNEAPAGWSVNEAPAEWNVNEAPAGWSVNEAPAEWNVNEAPAGWTTSEHANDDMEQTNSWSLNEDPTEWSTNSIDVDDNEEATYQGEQEHDNAADSSTGNEWVSSEHANDDHEDDASWSVNDGPAEWQADDNGHPNAAEWNVDHDNVAATEWSTSDHDNDDNEDEHVNAAEWNVKDTEPNHANSDPQWLTAQTEHSDAGSESWQVNDGWATNDVNW